VVVLIGDEIKSTVKYRSWFCVLHNPEKMFGEISPDDMVHKVIKMWCEDNPNRSCGVNYEITDAGTPHMHMVLEDKKQARFSTIKNMFKGIHIEATRGTKAEAEDYLYKRGKHNEKKHTVVVEPIFQGQIVGNQGKRKDLVYIEELIEEGYTPNDIMDLSIRYRTYETIIKKHYFRKRKKETPRIREVKVFWHVGNSGSGKSFCYNLLCEKYGDDKVYLLTDYDKGGFDEYCAESVLFMDEFKGEMKYQMLLNYLDGYNIQIHCRYANAYALWNEVHITSIYPIEEIYNIMVPESFRDRDNIAQLMRRIDVVVYHYKEENEYKSFELPAEKYKNYEELRTMSGESGFVQIDKAEQLEIPFKENIE